jgi:hypothetical protein
MPAEQQYSLPACIAIAVAPLALAFALIWFADPRGRILLDFRPLNWIADFAISWPAVLISAEILTAGKWLWLGPGGQVDVRMALRLTGGFTLIYICVWLLAVPLINVAAERFPGARIAPASYSQLLRFLTGIGGAVVLRLVRDVSSWKRLLP